jgi:peptide-methionine (S)-S-oxide reductase
MTRPTLLIALAALAGCGSSDSSAQAKPARTETAVFAGGCFWCTEADFEKLSGVVSAVSGYTGGRVANPSYERVSAGGTGHYEAVRIVYDPARIGYPQLVRHYFRTVDPTDSGGQFCDRGESYRTAIFALNPAQWEAANAERGRVNRLLKGKVVTPVLAASRFYPAEGYHQDYYKRNSVRYRYYRYRCGRDARLAKIWGATPK